MFKNWPTLGIFKYVREHILRTTDMQAAVNVKNHLLKPSDYIFLNRKLRLGQFIPETTALVSSYDTLKES
jgi:hypothetical protein